MKTSIFMNTLVRLSTLYRDFYEKGFQPEAARRRALAELSLPEDFKRDDHVLLCDGQRPEDYGCVSYEWLSRVKVILDAGGEEAEEMFFVLTSYPEGSPQRELAGV